MKLKKGYVVKNIGEQKVLIDAGKSRVDSSKAIFLNPAAEIIIKLMEEYTDKQELISAFARKYGLCQDIAGRDVSAFLDKMADKGFIETDEE